MQLWPLSVRVSNEYETLRQAWERSQRRANPLVNCDCLSIIMWLFTAWKCTALMVNRRLDRKRVSLDGRHWLRVEAEKKWWFLVHNFYVLFPSLPSLILYLRNNLRQAKRFSLIDTVLACHPRAKYYLPTHSSTFSSIRTPPFLLTFSPSYLLTKQKLGTMNQQWTEHFHSNSTLKSYENKNLFKTLTSHPSLFSTPSPRIILPSTPLFQRLKRKPWPTHKCNLASRNFTKLGWKILLRSKADICILSIFEY